MKCQKCGTEWISTVSNEFDNCPFCGELLKGLIPHHQVIDAFKALIEHLGVCIYSEEQRLIGLLNDVLPNALIEKNVLRTVVALGAPHIISRLASNPLDKEDVLRQTFELLQNGGLDATWCASALFMLAYPLGIDSSDIYPVTVAVDNHCADSTISRIIYDEKVETEYADKTFDELLSLALNEDPVALTELGERYYRGLEVAKDESLAVSYFYQAANLDYSVAQFIIGKLYEEGKLLEFEPSLAFEYYKRSAENDFPPAKYALGQAFFLGQICEKNDKEAIEWMLKAAEETDDSDIFVSLALLYRDSDDESIKDSAKAFQYAQKAVDMGNENAYNLLGTLYEAGCGVEQNYERALHFYRMGAEHGDEYAYLSIGAFYQMGIVVEKNFAKAAEYFQLGANVGNMYCLNALGICYKNGTGVACDEQKAFELFLNAAYAGNPAGELNVALAYFDGSGVEQDKVEAKKWLSLAAEHGVSQAMFMLGIYAEQGWTGGLPDLETAFKWYLKAANVGDHPVAAWIVGNCYSEGLLGVSIDKCSAFEWYLKAAELGHPTAQNNVATAFFLGEIVDLDYPYAVEWYEKAVEQHDVYALDNYGTILLQGNGVQRDAKRALQMFRYASEQGYAPSQCNLAICYFEGWGTTRNLDEALKWFVKAYNSGSETAFAYLQRGYRERTGTWVKKGVFGHTPSPRALNPPIARKLCRGGCMDNCDFAERHMPDSDSCENKYCFCNLTKTKVFIKKHCPNYDDAIYEASKLFRDS